MRNFLWLIGLILLISCAEEYTPKPTGYPRIDFPEKSYKTYSADCPFSFDYLESGMISNAKNGDNPCWLNLDYPFINARVHLSYKEIDDNLNKYLEDARTLAYKHTIKASAIDQKDMVNTETRVYAKIYHIDGDAASSVQFYATDSLKHFFRGALYFNAPSNADSLQPAIDYVREDVEVLVKSLQWN